MRTTGFYLVSMPIWQPSLFGTKKVPSSKIINRDLSIPDHIVISPYPHKNYILPLLSLVALLFFFFFFSGFFNSNTAKSKRE